MSPDVVEVYRPMAALLERMGREDELAEVLEVIHEREPGDLEIIFKLAGLYFGAAEYGRCLSVLGKL